MTRIADLKRQLADLHKPQTMHDLHNIAGDLVYGLVMAGFDAARDPYSQSWKPTRRSNPILQDTLALSRGIRWKADSRALVIGTTGPSNRYAAYHQRGTSRLPARKFLPDRGKIPPEYNR